jgi:site-specific recombinase XerC
MIPIPLDRADRVATCCVRHWSDSSFAIMRDSLAVSLGLCGLRWCEVSRSQMKDVDVVAGTIFVRSGKGGVNRTLPIGSLFAASLRKLVVRRKRSPSTERLDRVFFTNSGEVLAYEHIRRRLADWTKKVCGRSYSFHCLRHTAAVRCYRETGSVLAVSRLLGHRSLRWTDEYLKTLTAIDDRSLPFFTTNTSSIVRLYDPDRKVG